MRQFLVNWRIIFFVGVLLSAPPAVAAAHTRLEKTGTRVMLALYDAACDENPRECPIADIGCTSRGEFEVSIYGLKAKELGVWLSKNERVYLNIGAEQFSLRALRIENSDMTSDWDVYLSQFDDSAGVWRSVPNLTMQSLSLGARAVIFPRTVSALKNFRDLLKACVPN